MQPITTTSVHDVVQQRVRDYIVASGLQPGAPLPSEAELTEQLGVSRTMVREALRSLEALGMISSRRGQRRYVSEFNLDPVLHGLSYWLLSDIGNVRDILAIREQLEAGFVGQATQNMDEDTLRRLRGLVAEMMRKSQAGERFTAEDLAFHRAIFETTGNRLLVRLLDVFWQVYQNLRDRVLAYPEDPADPTARNHADILAAIEDKDAVEARKRIIGHFDGIRRRLNASVAPPQ